MRVAFAYWDKRIAPVFDAARMLQIVEVLENKILVETKEAFLDDVPPQKAQFLAAQHIDLLVCGAISKPLYGMIRAIGIEIIPFVTGDLNDVMQAWLDGNLERSEFTMPGCCGHGYRRRMQARSKKEVEVNNSDNAKKQRGGGQRRSGIGKGRMGGSKAKGTGGNCVCPQCGHTEPHERGIPCVQKQCPQCGAVMMRQ